MVSPDRSESLLHFGARVFRKVRSDDLMTRASSLAFTTLVSLVPLLAAASFLYARFLKEGEERLVQALTPILPYSEAEVLAAIRQFVSQAVGLSLWGTLGFLLFALLALRSGEAALEAIFEVSRPRSLLGRWLRLGAFLVWGPLALLTAQALDLFLTGRITGRAVVALWISRLLMLAWLFLGFTLIYYLAAAGRLRFRHAMAGAFLAALLLELLRWAFLAYLSLFSSTTRLVYGGFAIAFFFVLSIQLAWWVVLASASFAICFSDPRAGLPATPERLPIGNALELLSLLVALAKAGSMGATSPELQNQLACTPETLRALLAPLVGRGWVLEPSPSQPRWRLAVPASEIRVGEVITLLQPGLPQPPQLRELAVRFQELLSSKLGSTSLTELSSASETNSPEVENPLA